MIEALITGAAIGIVGCLGGQGVMMKLNSNDTQKLEGRVAELEAREVVLKDAEFMSRSEMQEFMNGFAAQAQGVINEQYASMMQQIQMVSTGVRQNEQAARIAEARAQAMAPPAQPQMNVAAIAEMQQKIDLMQSQIGG